MYWRFSSIIQILFPWRSLVLLNADFRLKCRLNILCFIKGDFIISHLYSLLPAQAKSLQTRQLRPASDVNEIYCWYKIMAIYALLHWVWGELVHNDSWPSFQFFLVILHLFVVRSSFFLQSFVTLQQRILPPIETNRTTHPWATRPPTTVQLQYIG